MSGPLILSRNAAFVGHQFIQRYYDVLKSQPEKAYQFYDNLGEYQTVFEDGTVVVARTWQEINSVLLHPTLASNLVINTINSVPCGKSLNHLMITVTGKGFTHVYFAEYRSELELAYAIMASVNVHTEPASDMTPLTPVTSLAAHNYPVEKAANDIPPAILKVKKRVQFHDNIATYYEPPPRNVTDSPAKQQPIKFSIRVPSQAKIPISQESSPTTVTDNTQSNVGAKCLPMGILRRVLTSVENSRPHVPSVNTDIKNTQPNIATIHSQNRITNNVSTPTVIAGSHVTSVNTDTKNTHSNIAANYSPNVIKNGVTVSAEMASSRVASANTPIKNTRSNIAANYSPNVIKNGVTVSAEISSLHKSSSNSVKDHVSPGVIRRKRKVREDGYLLEPTPNFQIFSTLGNTINVLEPDDASRNMKKRPRNPFIELL